MSCSPNPYTSVCTSTVLNLISGLQNLGLPVYQNFIQQEGKRGPTLFTLLPNSNPSMDSRYLMIQSEIDAIPNNPWETLLFHSVNESKSGTLLADYDQVNVLKATLVTYKSALYVVYKNIHYVMKFPVADIDLLRPIKSVLMNLYSLPGLTFVVWDKWVLHFSQYVNSDSGVNDPYFRLTFIGQLGHDSSGKTNICAPFVNYDFCNGTLVGLIDHHPFFFFNRFGLGTVNHFPNTNYVGLGPLNRNSILLGGVNTYSIAARPNSEFEGPIYNLWQINITTELQFQFNELATDLTWGFVSLSQLILIEGSGCDFSTGEQFGPFYIAGFSQAELPPLSYVGTTEFLNSNNTIITFPIVTKYTLNFSQYQWSVYPTDGSVITPEPGYLYYVFGIEDEGLPTQKYVLIYFESTFASFLEKYRGTTGIQDLWYGQSINEQVLSMTNEPYSSLSCLPYEVRKDQKTKYDSYFCRSPLTYLPSPFGYMNGISTDKKSVAFEGNGFGFGGNGFGVGGNGFGFGGNGFGFGGNGFGVGGNGFGVGGNGFGFGGNGFGGNGFGFGGNGFGFGGNGFGGNGFGFGGNGFGGNGFGFGGNGFGVGGNGFGFGGNGFGFGGNGFGGNGFGFGGNGFGGNGFGFGGNGFGGNGFGGNAGGGGQTNQGEGLYIHRKKNVQNNYPIQKLRE